MRRSIIWLCLEVRRWYEWDDRGSGCRERSQPIEKTTFAHDYLSTSQLKRLLDWTRGNLHLQDNNGVVEGVQHLKPHSSLFLTNILYNNEQFYSWIYNRMGLKQKCNQLVFILLLVPFITHVFVFFTNTTIKN